MLPIREVSHVLSGVEDEDVSAHGLIDGDHQLREDTRGIVSAPLKDEGLPRTTRNLHTYVRTYEQRWRNAQ